MKKVWKQKKEFNSQILQEYSKKLGFQHSTFVPLLVNRNITNKESLESYFHSSEEQLHDPFLMLNMEKAVQRILGAYSEQQKIMIYGDYDVDGTTSVALVYRFLKPYFNKIEYYIPDRHKEGYGISAQSIDYAAKNKIKLIIALDCGIRSNSLIEKAKKEGIDYIICDHHLPGEEVPKAAAVLDPKQSNCPYPFKELSGCGIGYKLCQALCMADFADIDELNGSLDLVAVSIVSDLVELTGENRNLVKLGLDKLRQNPIIGFQKIIQESITKEWVDVEEILFMIGPRINAAGRLASAKTAVELLICEDENDADLYSELLQNLNTQRKAKDQNTTKEALSQIENDPTFENKKSTVVYKSDWHKGVIGIVASRIQETHYRPTIVLTKSENKITGSARSIKGFNIHDALIECSEYLNQFGGHKYAGGMTLEEENIKAFSEAFDQVAQRELSDEDLVPTIEYDIELDWKKISDKLLEKLKQFGPFGPGNMQPIFLSKNLFDSGYSKTLGSDHSHLRINLWDQETGKGISGIGFNLGHHYSKIKLKQPFNMLYSIEENHYNGSSSIQLNIKDIRFL